MRRSSKTILLAVMLAGLAGAPSRAEEHPIEADPTASVYSFSGAFLAARAAEVNGDLATAVEYYERALAFDPSNIDVQQSLMLLHLTRGDFEAAVPYARDLQDAPDIERFARLVLAIDELREGDFAEALPLLDFEGQSDLDRLVTSVMSAWIEAEEGKPEAALERLDGVGGPAWYELFLNYHTALIAARAGMDERAEQAFSMAVGNLEAGGGAPDTFLRASEAYARFQALNGDTEAALATLDEAAELAPFRPTITALREKIEAGEEIEPHVTGPVGGSTEILLNLASALNRSGGESFVRLYLNYALALEPENAQILLQLGSVAEGQDDSEAAIDYYSQIPEDSPVRRISELQVGLNLADLDRHEEAVAHLRPLLEEAPEDMRAYLALGGVYASQEKFAEAAEVYDRAVENIGEPQPEHWNIYYQRGIAYERIDEWEKAEPNFFQALELAPDHPQILNYLGYSWVDMNIKLEEGLELIKKAVELRPSDGYIVDSLGWAYYRLGRYEDAVRELERAVSLMPSDPILNDHLGDAYWRVGRQLEARFQWRHAKSLEPEQDLLVELEKKLAEGLEDEPESVSAERRTEAAPPPPADEDEDGGRS